MNMSESQRRHGRQSDVVRVAVCKGPSERRFPRLFVLDTSFEEAFMVTPHPVAGLMSPPPWAPTARPPVIESP